MHTHSAKSIAYLTTPWSKIPNECNKSFTFGAKESACRFLDIVKDQEPLLLTWFNFDPSMDK